MNRIVPGWLALLIFVSVFASFILGIYYNNYTIACGVPSGILGLLILAVIIFPSDDEPSRTKDTSYSEYYPKEGHGGGPGTDQ